jgi:tellurite resistance protein TerC
MPQNALYWLLFVAFVAAMLVLDLAVLNRRARPVAMGQALGWCALWFTLAAAFAALLYFHGQRITGDLSHPNRQLALEFITGYTVEEALSVDNLFVFLLIFRSFGVPAELQHRVLFWGVLGAMAMRAAFIAAGIALLSVFHWAVYLFGAFLIYAAIRLLVQRGSANPGDNGVTGFVQRHLRFTQDFGDGHFTALRDGRSMLTRLALVLIVIEATDVLFAVDSIPAVLAVTRQPFVVFTSNIFAVLGLRSLYFALASLMERFRFLHYGLALILGFIGLKMLTSNWLAIPTAWALAVIALLLAASVVLSLLLPPRHGAPASPRALGADNLGE